MSLNKRQPLLQSRNEFDTNVKHSREVCDSEYLQKVQVMSLISDQSGEGRNDVNDEQKPAD